eukprot:m51a1_g11507 hypothetical protein (393) ;mRNA; r:8599-10214
MLLAFEAAGGVVTNEVVERSIPALQPLTSFAEFQTALKNVKDLLRLQTVQVKRRSAPSLVEPAAGLSEEESFNASLVEQLSKLVDQATGIITDEHTFKVAQERAGERPPTWFEEVIKARHAASSNVNAGLKAIAKLSAVAAEAASDTSDKSESRDAAFIVDKIAAITSNQIVQDIWLFGQLVWQVVKAVFIEVTAKDLVTALKESMTPFALMLADLVELGMDISECVRAWKAYNSIMDRASHVFGATTADAGFFFIVLESNPGLVLDVKDSSTAWGADIVVAPFSGSGSQQWRFDAEGLVTPRHCQGCWDDWTGRMHSGDSLKLGFLKPGDTKVNKLFRFLQNGAISLVQADLVLEVRGDPAAGSTIVLMPFNSIDHDKQSWRLVTTYSPSF